MPKKKIKPKQYTKNWYTKPNGENVVVSFSPIENVEKKAF